MQTSDEDTGAKENATDMEHRLRARIAGLEADNARLRGLLERQGLPAELRHQVRNTLANLRAIIRRSARTNRTVEDYAAHLEGRLDAILSVQKVIDTQSSRGIDLHTLISDELHRQDVLEGEKAHLFGPPILLQPRAAEVLALAVHELTVNALEHGGLTRPQARIAVDWTLDTNVAPPCLDLRWRETGVGISDPIAPPGFGADVLHNMLRYEFEADTKSIYDSEGLICTVRLPLPPKSGVLGDENREDLSFE